MDKTLIKLTAEKLAKTANHNRRDLVSYAQTAKEIAKSENLEFKPSDLVSLKAAIDAEMEQIIKPVEASPSIPKTGNFAGVAKLPKLDISKLNEDQQKELLASLKQTASTYEKTVENNRKESAKNEVKKLTLEAERIKAETAKLVQEASARAKAASKLTTDIFATFAKEFGLPNSCYMVGGKVYFFSPKTNQGIRQVCLSLSQLKKDGSDFLIRANNFFPWTDEQKKIVEKIEHAIVIGAINV